MEIVYWICGVIVGIICSILWSRAHVCGTIEVDCSDPDKDVYRLVVNDLKSLTRKRRIVFKVNRNAHFSREEQSV